MYSVLIPCILELDDIEGIRLVSEEIILLYSFNF